ncbi:Por secretion system C-terminal sorting domain-containing protein [Flexibacter flexilis DSM 6793]|uniref:Por secretion system C-terminal sorting domain-containing protein n=1 Tax=Flexibacter flexilis DSM 6793 TaxID=927664 RepID=A0A1I1J912_9BACT|nr:peptide-N-glycosidase F-related protein [Flexibacter flexilis]SFC44482.1 Por secretion system C-terminal sorting domain-containing protein [Flexibacter flexilis DSM 6793]
MKKNLLFALLGLLFSPKLLAQDTLTVFNNVPFYSMYHYLGAGQTLPVEAYSQIPQDAIRIHAYELDVISRKLTVNEISALGSSLTVNVTLIAACDNYDRLAGVNLVLAPKGDTTYTWDQANIKRIEIGRFITPFMNKNATIKQVPYTYRVDNIASLLHDSTLMANYDAWIEFRADGYSAAANTEVAGCANRTDVFRGTLTFVSDGAPDTTSNKFFLPISYRQNLNNYNATDVAGQTTRIVNFTLDQPVENAVLYLITSNHGSNSGGEEYNRREHYVYLDNELKFHYKPGGKSCEPYRQYNTQGNGIYGSAVQPVRSWLSFNNWCPGDAVPNREIQLGNLAAGSHSIKLDVPTAVFTGGQGYFPVSMYIQNRPSGQEICRAPYNLAITGQAADSVSLSWTENGQSTQWEVLWGRKGVYSTSNDFYQPVNGTPVISRDSLKKTWFYEMYVRSKCDGGSNSEWVGPVFSAKIVAAKPNQNPNVSVYPSPTKDVVYISAPTAIEKVWVYAADGRRVLESSEAKVNLSGLGKGMYLFAVYFADGQFATHQIVKE